MATFSRGKSFSACRAAKISVVLLVCRISLWDMHCAPTRWVLAFSPGVFNFSSDVPKYRSLGGYMYTF